MYVLYGIKNCDKVAAARKWLEKNHVDFSFEDIRENPVKKSNWEKWIDTFTLDKVINKRSTTWKQLPETVKQNLSSQTAVQLLNQYPTLMKRPLLAKHGIGQMIGFSDKQYVKYFNQ